MSKNGWTTDGTKGTINKGRLAQIGDDHQRHKIWVFKNKAFTRIMCNLNISLVFTVPILHKNNAEDYYLATLDG